MMQVGWSINYGITDILSHHWAYGKGTQLKVDAPGRLQPIKRLLRDVNKCQNLNMMLNFSLKGYDLKGKTFSMCFNQIEEQNRESLGVPMAQIQWNVSADGAQFNLTAFKLSAACNVLLQHWFCIHTIFSNREINKWASACKVTVLFALSCSGAKLCSQTKPASQSIAIYSHLHTYVRTHIQM